MFQIGNVFFTAVPGEFTTMSGRRLRNAVKNAVIENGGSDDTRVIITGLSNVYTNYIATPEEYQVIRILIRDRKFFVKNRTQLTIYLFIYNWNTGRFLNKHKESRGAFCGQDEGFLVMPGDNGKWDHAVKFL